MNYLIIFIIFSLSLFAQKPSSISNAFTNGNILGNISLFSYNIDAKNKENTYASALGGFLKYTTDEENPLVNDLVVQICFDSDRLDIGRVGIIPEAKYMATDYAKSLT